MKASAPGIAACSGASFQQAGLVEGERPAPEDTDPVVDAAIRYIAKTPCTLKLLSIEDALGIRTQPNVPGTTTEKPNWRHRLDGDAGALLDDEAVPAAPAPSRGAARERRAVAEPRADPLPRLRWEG